MSSTITAIKTSSSTQKDIPPPSTLSSLDQRVATVASSSSSSSFSSSSVSSSPTATLSADFGTRAVSQVKANQLHVTDVVKNLVVKDGTYSGRVNPQGQPHGLGVLKFSNDGSKPQITYIGYFTNGKLNGKGRMDWGNGEIYEGQFVDGIIHGEGEATIYREKRKMQYAGEFNQNFFLRGYVNIWCDPEEGKPRFMYWRGEFRDSVLYDGFMEFYDKNDDCYDSVYYKNGEEYEPQAECVML